MKRIALFILIALAFLYTESNAREAVNVVPRPNVVEHFKGTFLLSKSTKIECPERLDGIAGYLSGQLKLFAGFSPAIRPNSAGVKRGVISLILNPALAEPTREAYVLEVSKYGVEIKSRTEAGVFMGVQTLLQLVPVSSSGEFLREYSLPCCRIVDHPRFGWRGVNLDCVRHFMSVPFIKRLIDLMAYYKFDIFHWHLTDDQGWRIQIKKYPKLTEVGAWRTEPDGSRYGGYYTDKQIREVVAYARSRFITVVPEIEMPGHCTASLASYPENSCTGGPFKVGTRWGVYNNVYCPSKKSTFTFLDNILTEVMHLFPSHYIHIGGDEVVKKQWKDSKACEELIKEKGLDGVDGLQSYFVRKIQRFVESKGRQIIGWNEILQGGGPEPGAVIESWQGINGAIQAVKQGCYAIVSPGEYTYLSREPSNLSIDSVYSFNPMPPGLSPKEQKYILGTEASMWTEHAPQDSVMGLLFPRLLAMAEDAWTVPQRKNYENFHKRLQEQYNRLGLLGVKYGLEGEGIGYRTKFNSVRRQFAVSFEPEQRGIKILYTTDGKMPTLASSEYSDPIVIKGTTELIARAKLNGRLAGRPVDLSFIVDKAVGAHVSLKFPYSPRYSAGGPEALANGIRATTSFTDGLWQGYHGTDVAATLDLKKEESISRIGAEFLQDENNWIFMPRSVEFLVSEDGKRFESVGTVKNDVPEKDPSVVKKDFVTTFQKRQVRYIRMIAASIQVCPPWHSGAGQKAWTFIDEIFAD